MATDPVLPKPTRQWTERQLSYYRKLSEGKKYRVCEMSNLNYLTVVKSLVCNKLCEIYRSVSDFIVERILYAYKQTIRTDIFESNIESLLI